MTISDYISEYLEMEKKTIESLNREELLSVVNTFLDVYEKEGTIYVFGNGGSASTASHMANDYNKGLNEFLDKKFRFVCLNDNVATLMSIANDISYEEVFRMQLRGKLEEKDLVVGISGSGNSMNVINAISYAKEMGVKTVGLCGYEGGKLKALSDVVLHVKLNNMQIVEDIHLIFNHLLMYVCQRHMNIPSCH
ncbi:MAG: SIS domain-containing protein [Candidatus Ornithospirochaeta sp.]|nr:SIS domain-containing protein [Sphaerochaetaceae bacterium]MDY5523022.1 SIS domain-containing protein [Candidatus Ornithospirochaeta sp.]